MTSVRCGLIARKCGMTRIFTSTGMHIPVTVLHVLDCQVVEQKTEERHGYTALQIGTGFVKVRKLSKALRGHFARARVEPKRKLTEFRVTPDALLDVGTTLRADHFIVDQYVDVTGMSIGKGFAGAMKRWNFSGLRASHGTSVSHRSHGSTGQRQDPGRVFKNKKMAGHLGHKRVTVCNLRVVQVDVDRGLLLVRGAVPGAEEGYVFLRDAIKRKRPDNVPFPAVSSTTTGEESSVDV